MNPDAGELTRLVSEQRWFGAKARGPLRGEVVSAWALAADCTLALFELELGDGRRELYQLPYRTEAGTGRALIELADPVLAGALIAALRASARLEAPGGSVEFELAGPLPPQAALEPARPPGGEQSNSSLVLGERVILKAYRRLEAGESPELEVLRFLGAHGFEHVPPLAGSYRCATPALTATLGIVQAYVPGARDGWELALESFAEPGPFLARLRRLGEVTALMHASLASDGSDEAFAPVSLGDDGWAIREHGDYHLGQVLWAAGDWLVIDFEGEPARPLPERRRKRSPLRDLACMLRSFAYAAEVGRRAGRARTAQWEATARAELLAGYGAAGGGALLPATQAARERLLEAFELEKAFAELHYELDNRPGWAHVPAAGIVRLLRGA